MHFIKLGVIFLFIFKTTFTQELTTTTKTLELSDFGIYDTDLLPASFHKKNREKLRALMPSNSISVFFSNPIKNRSNDVDFQYHQDPNFYYLTGLREPHSILFLLKSPIESLFNLKTTVKKYGQENELGK